jgi:ATP-binding protein involved in chromosome partitioning
MQENTTVAQALTAVTRAVVSEVVARNEHLPPTEAIKITTMAGCAAVTKK